MPVDFPVGPSWYPTCSSRRDRIYPDTDSVKPHLSSRLPSYRIQARFPAPASPPPCPLSPQSIPISRRRILSLSRAPGYRSRQNQIKTTDGIEKDARQEGGNRLAWQCAPAEDSPPRVRITAVRQAGSLGGERYPYIHSGTPQ
ncbi:hypothetical protein VTK73DRAFT_6014 [Phialemonium thermophilum]|uniref:Uncharacterized protein n=1 Tax=Phialemonium thermophilum TaxID=223376 RepID=A0ABR3V046_9PEZI